MRLSLIVCRLSPAAAAAAQSGCPRTWQGPSDRVVGRALGSRCVPGEEAAQLM